MRKDFNFLLKVPIFTFTDNAEYISFHIFTAWKWNERLPSSVLYTGIWSWFACLVLYWCISEFLSNMFNICGNQPWWYLYIRRPILYLCNLVILSTDKLINRGSLWLKRLTPDMIRTIFFWSNSILFRWTCADEPHIWMQ